MNFTKFLTTESIGSQLTSSQWLTCLSFCPNCLQRVYFGSIDEARAWIHCSKRWMASLSVICPNSVCRRSFDFAGHRRCPFCHLEFDDGIPLAPFPAEAGLLDRILPGRRFAARVQHERAENEFKQLFDSWQRDSTSYPQVAADTDSRFSRDLRVVLSRHGQILFAFNEDVEKFLYAAPIRLAKHEGEYSWKLEEALAKEISSVLDGMLQGCHSSGQSLGYIARYHDRLPNSYSRKFLAKELRRRFYERRSAPRPGFQLTLEYARTLDGIAFEEWLTRLLRDAGIPGACKTQASRDQGADIVVTIGSRKIVVQAKNYQDTTGNKSVQEALGALHYYHATEAWVVTTSTFSQDAIDLAFHTGVRLVDGSRLLNLPDLLRGSAQTASEVSIKQDDSHLPVTRDSTQLELAADDSARIPATSTTPSDPANGGPNPEVPSLLNIGLQSSVSRPVWRDWRLVGLGMGAIIWLAIFAAFHFHETQPKTGDQKRIQESSERGIRGLLETYLNAERARNPELLANCYAPEVWTFYLRRNVTRNDVLLEFQRSFAIYQDVSMVRMSKINFSSLSETAAAATFDKEWDFRGKKYSSGAEREEMIFRNIDGNWLIVSERELKVYWTRHTIP